MINFYLKTVIRGPPAKVAALLNWERIENSKDGFVPHWYIRVRVGSKYANLSVTLPMPWKPKDEYDLPPAFIRIKGPREQCKQIVGELNNRFDQCELGEPRKRAYIACSDFSRLAMVGRESV